MKGTLLCSFFLVTSPIHTPFVFKHKSLVMALLRNFPCISIFFLHKNNNRSTFWTKAMNIILYLKIATLTFQIIGTIWHPWSVDVRICLTILLISIPKKNCNSSNQIYKEEEILCYQISRSRVFIDILYHNIPYLKS